MKKRGRKKLSVETKLVNVSINLPPDILQQYEEIAVEGHVPRSEVMRDGLCLVLPRMRRKFITLESKGE